jgi:hypothetical protein
MLRIPRLDLLRLILNMGKEGIIEEQELVLGYAGSFGEIPSVIPDGYVECVREGLRKLSEMARKLSEMARKAVSVKLALDELNRHVMLKMWPGALMLLGYPKIEISAEFERTKPSVLSESLQLYDRYRCEALGL